MSREIKFRAWDKENKRMIENTIIIPQTDGSFMLYNAGFNQTGEGQGSILVETQFDVGDFVPLQYTGLKDRHGVEIYEGDILAVGGKPFYKVEWANHMSMFNLVKLENGESSTDDMWLCEIIGNKYENKDLIK